MAFLLIPHSGSWKGKNTRGISKKQKEFWCDQWTDSLSTFLGGHQIVPHVKLNRSWQLALESRTENYPSKISNASLGKQLAHMDSSPHKIYPAKKQYHKHSSNASVRLMKQTQGHLTLLKQNESEASLGRIALCLEARTPNETYMSVFCTEDQPNVRRISKLILKYWIRYFFPESL